MLYMAGQPLLESLQILLPCEVLTAYQLASGEHEQMDSIRHLLVNNSAQFQNT